MEDIGTWAAGAKVMVGARLWELTGHPLTLTDAAAAAAHGMLVVHAQSSRCSMDPVRDIDQCCSDGADAAEEEEEIAALRRPLAEVPAAAAAAYVVVVVAGPATMMVGGAGLAVSNAMPSFGDPVDPCGEVAAAGAG